MKKLLTLTLCLLAVMAQAQIASILGDWKTVDDKTGQEFSVVRIYQGTDGLYYGKIVEMLVGGPDLKCIECAGEDAQAPIVGLVIIRQMKAENGELVGGRVLDPNNGKFYYGKIYLKDGKLVLRGSLDKKGIFGRSQTWIRK